MCCILAKPRYSKLPSLAQLERIARANPDGFGLVTHKYTIKTLSWSKFKEALSEVSPSTPCLIHFRRATHGSVSIKNCHPFSHNHVYMMHNGTIPCNPHNDMTDSEYFLQNYIGPVIDTFGMGSFEFKKVLTRVGHQD